LRTASAEANASLVKLQDILEGKRSEAIDFSGDVCRAINSKRNTLDDMVDCSSWKEPLIVDVLALPHSAFPTGPLANIFEATSDPWGLIEYPVFSDTKERYIRRSGIADIIEDCELGAGIGPDIIKLFPTIILIANLFDPRSDGSAMRKADIENHLRELIPNLDSLTLSQFAVAYDSVLDTMRGLFERAETECRRVVQSQSIAIGRLRTALESDRDELARLYASPD